MPAPISLDRLIERIEFTPTCWNWRGPVAGYGYGVTKIARQQWYTHRLAYFLNYLELPKELDHKCRNRLCMNPEHLEPVTHKENMRRYLSTITHCPHGHEYTTRNIKIHFNRRDGTRDRQCRVCANERTREWNRKYGKDYRESRRRGEAWVRH